MKATSVGHWPVQVTNVCGIYLPMCINVPMYIPVYNYLRPRYSSHFNVIVREDRCVTTATMRFRCFAAFCGRRGGGWRIKICWSVVDTVELLMAPLMVLPLPLYCISRMTRRGSEGSGIKLSMKKVSEHLNFLKRSHVREKVEMDILRFQI